MNLLQVTAEHVLGHVADGLSDPGRMASAATVMSSLPPDLRVIDTGALSMSGGHTGVALLFGVLGDRERAYAHLARAASLPDPPGSGGLWTGLPALAMATCLTAAAPGDYATLLGQLDTFVAGVVRRRLRAFRQELTRRRPRGFHHYDIPYGLTGLGRYLLLRGEHDLVADVLASLVELTRPIAVGGDELPGWWVEGGPTLRDVDGYELGHGNLGVAHGITGPLSLLAIAMEQGVRVPGQDAAMERIVEWLLDRRLEDGHGPFWPATVTLPEQLGIRPRSDTAFRASWCYGTPGIARALQLAGRALGRSSWEEAAVGAMRAMRDRPVADWGVSGASLCHGWAGILRTSWRIAEDSGDSAVRSIVGTAATRLLALYDAGSPFGFRYPLGHGVEIDVAGAIEGAAGIGLALRSCLLAEARSDWDTLLLLS
ncbi:lanthionine synthetase C family protein [Nonomuraea sp. NPDC049269]|uniref:lanthionine synthetase C family protein n=1 Tax=Nonomuraea sp. NPDC049269 TaxID=3364349 RepID=UPI00371D8181